MIEPFFDSSDIISKLQQDFSTDDSTFSTRRDVVNKTVLRKMRKYFLTQFKKEESASKVLVHRKTDNTDLLKVTDSFARIVIDWA